MTRARWITIGFLAVLGIVVWVRWAPSEGGRAPGGPADRAAAAGRHSHPVLESGARGNRPDAAKEGGAARDKKPTEEPGRIEGRIVAARPVSGPILVYAQRLVLQSKDEREAALLRASGLPWSSANVPHAQLTGSGGRFTISQLEPGSYRLVVTAPNRPAEVLAVQAGPIFMQGIWRRFWLLERATPFGFWKRPR